MFSKYTKIASITLAVFIVNMAIALNAHAQYSQIYVEVSYGQLALDDFEFFFDYSDFEDESGNDEVVGFAVGRRFNDNIAVEIGYFDFGSFESEITSFLPVPEFDDMGVVVALHPSVPDFSEFKISSVQMSIIGSLHWGQRFTFFVKGGISQGNVTVKFFDNNFNFVGRGSESGSGLHFGAGMMVNITRSIALELEYQASNISNSLLVDNIAMQTTTIGLRYNF